MNANALERVQQSFDAVPRSARAARQFVTDALRQREAPAKVIRDYVLVVSELVTNIIEHGDAATLVIYLDLSDPEWWEVEVVGGSSTLPSAALLRPESWAVADAGEPSGRGLGIVRHLMDDISAGSKGGQVSICCRQRRDPV